MRIVSNCGDSELSARFKKLYFKLSIFSVVLSLFLIFVDVIGIKKDTGASSDFIFCSALFLFSGAFYVFYRYRSVYASRGSEIF